MKNLGVMIIGVMVSTSAFAAEVLNCATGVGSYDEVQKFQVVQAGNQLLVKSSLMAGNKVLGECRADTSSLYCEFRGPGSVRPYRVNLIKNSHGYEGTIDQAMRAEGFVSCTF